MPNAKLSASSGLERLAHAGRTGATTQIPGVTIALRSGVALAWVAARKGRMDELAQRCRAAFGIDLPVTPRRVASGSTAFIWAVPGEWLATADGLSGGAFERLLRGEIAGLASIGDQSDQRTLIRVDGPKIRETLMKGVMVDLHPRAFGPGDTAATVINHVAVQIWQLDAVPTYEIAAPRGVSAHFWHWLVEAGSEYGVTIDAAD